MLVNWFRSNDKPGFGSHAAGCIKEAQSNVPALQPSTVSDVATLLYLHHSLCMLPCTVMSVRLYSSPCQVRSDRTLGACVITTCSGVWAGGVRERRPR